MEQRELLSTGTKTPSEKVAAAYIRVSTSRQSRDGQSLPAQREKVEKYAKDRGWELKYVFSDKAPATKFENKIFNKAELAENYQEIRPELTRLLIEAERRSFKHLIVCSMDRMSRVVEEYVAIDVFLSKFDIDIIYLREGENCDTGSESINKLIRVILSSIAEFETNLLSNRVRGGNKKMPRPRLVARWESSIWIL